MTVTIISWNDFGKVELRVGRNIKAELLAGVEAPPGLIADTLYSMTRSTWYRLFFQGRVSVHHEKCH